MFGANQRKKPITPWKSLQVDFRENYLPAMKSQSGVVNVTAILRCHFPSDS
jgi:hypothetical protein